MRVLRKPAGLALVDGAYALTRPLFFRLDAERAHELILLLLRVASAAPPALAVVQRLLGTDRPGQEVEAFGLRFPNVLGLAAGLDKNGVAVPAWAALGFGHVEVGTFTARGQMGNPRPRVFRLPADRGLINRMGFPNRGAEAVARRLARLPHGRRVVVGGNVGKGKDTPLVDAPAEYAVSARAVLPYVDYLAANISSPNTVGLRNLQAPEQVAAIMAALKPLGTKPVLVKLAPDLPVEALPDIVAAAREGGAAGLIATNTTVERVGLVTPSAAAREAGGLSGVPLRAMAQAFTAHLAEAAGPDLPIIAVGGIATAADVRERLAAGARLVQVYTALVYEGPGLAARLVSELSAIGD